MSLKLVVDPFSLQVFHHAILNLPDSALTFLDTFRGVDWKANGFEKPPTVHVYCFSKAADPKQVIRPQLSLPCFGLLAVFSSRIGSRTYRVK